MGELFEIAANTPNFNLVLVAKNRHEIYTGPNFVPFDLDYSVAHALGSLAIWHLAF